MRSEQRQKSLQDQFPNSKDVLTITRGNNVDAVKQSNVVILGADPADIGQVLREPGLKEALTGQQQLVISIVAGWTKQELETTLYGSPTTADNQANRAYVIKTLPNIAARVSQSMTALEVSSEPPFLPDHLLQLTGAIFEKIGRAVRLPPRLMNAATAVGGSTPAFFSVICDAMIDAAVAVGVPRDQANAMVVQSMLGTATLLQSGVHPGVLKDQGTSPEGCTIGGLMVMEEGAVRGHVGRAVREAVTLARLMGTVEHVNDTRRE